ncbi:FkbM family methyltransferase [Candidatus Thioglobus sp.]|nr:FkbM family methyltransferase [Candidatus Thioglobus sp.]
MDKNIFIDIGAHVGNHSLYFSKYCYEIHSFEPNLNLVKKFKENIVVNNLYNIMVHDLGLGDTTKKLEFYFSVGCNQGTGSFVKNHSYNNKKEMLNISVSDFLFYIDGQKDI